VKDRPNIQGMQFSDLEDVQLGDESPGTLGSAFVIRWYLTTAEVESEQRFDEGTNRFAFELRWHLKCRLWYSISVCGI